MAIQVCLSTLSKVMKVKISSDLDQLAGPFVMMMQDMHSNEHRLLILTQ